MKFLDDIDIYKLKKMNVDEMTQLSKEIREFLIEKVSKTGGHLGSNLGAVEITLAMHYVFDSPSDKLLFDVGHQIYTHKILTGRKDRFDSLRQYKGLSGFPRVDESPHDAFSMGHTSNSLSVALGMARARDMQKENYNVVALIGDGALTGGMALEALNDTGTTKNKVIFILNDNNMSIAKNVGAMAGFLGKIRTIKTYDRFKRSFSHGLEKIPFIGNSLKDGISKTKNRFKYFLLPTTFFEEMGFTYIGVLDGHDIHSLIESLNDAKKINRPVILHIRTVKGKGHKEAEEFPELFHGIAANFGVKNQNSKEISNGKVFTDKLIEMAKKDDKICAITAAMPHGTGLIEFQTKFPDRFMDVGIAEQHATTLAAGLASGGAKPYFAVYSTFLQRAYDQIFHDVCLQNLPVVIVIDRAGLVGSDGETHHGVFDLAYLRPFPNMTIMAPATKNELREMMDIANELEGPCAIRYSKINFSCDYDIKTEFGKWKILEPINDITILAHGDMVQTALNAALKIKKAYGINIGVVNTTFIKPMDMEVLTKLLNCKHIITLENHVTIGGMGSGVLEELNKLGYNNDINIMGIPDRFVTHGSVSDLLKEVGLDEDSVVKTIEGLLER